MKLKKIASLALAGVMAVSMLAGCNSVSNNPQPTPPNSGVGNTVTGGKSSVFEAALSDRADLKIDMQDSAELSSALEAAAQNVGSATIIDFTTAIRSANVNGGSSARVVATFDQGGRVYLTSPFGTQTGLVAPDLGVVATRMDAGTITNSFNDLIPIYNTAEDDDSETVTMLFAVDGAVGEDAAVEQVAEVLDSRIRALQIDNDADNNNGNNTGNDDRTSLHYDYTGSASITTRTLADAHGISMHIVAVQITRTAKV